MSGPSHGTLSGTGANVTYTPETNYNGSDSFVFTASDGTLSNRATVTISVKPINDAPVAQNQSMDSIRTLPRTSRSGPLTWTGTPSHDSLTGTGANRIYTPNSNYVGVDSFTFRAKDRKLNSNTATVAITVMPPNELPTISDISDQSTNEDTATGEIPFTVDDEETATADLTFSGSSDNHTLVPDENIEFGGTGANRTVKGISPASNESGTANISITVTEAVTFGVTNDNNSLFLAQPAISSFTGTLTYTPARDTNGSATVTAEAKDDGGTDNGGSDTSAEKTFTITVNPVNDVPTDISLSSTSVSANQPAGTAVGTFSTTDPDTSDTFAYRIATASLSEIKTLRVTLVLRLGALQRAASARSTRTRRCSHCSVPRLEV